MKTSYLGKRGWVFHFAGTELFITSFAGCYGQNHPRYAFGLEGWSLILFQPYHSFVTHLVGNDTPRSATEWDKPTTIRDKIRCGFKRNGREYYIPEDPSAFPVANAFVPPLDALSTQFVRWWESI